MVVNIAYGDDKLTLKLPDQISFDEFEYKSAGTTVDCEEFDDILKNAEKTLFPVLDADLYVLNDAYRPTPTAIILNWIDALHKLNDKSRFIVATGTHQAPNDNQFRRIFGGLYDKLKNRIVIHDARDIESMAEIGKDSLNGTVYLNRTFVESDKVVVIGSVEPHYFAGFTGGRKSIFPGLCDLETTARNHNQAAGLDSAPMRLDGNLVHKHLQELMLLVSEQKILSIQTVPGAGSGNDEVALFCGDLNESFEKARQLSRQIYAVDCQEQFDLLLAEVRPPLDGSLYQLQKSLENCQMAVKEGGTMILFSPCKEGIGSEGFYKLAENWNPDTDTIPTGADAFGIHKLYRVCNIGKRIEVDLYSDLPEGVSDKVYFKSISDPQSVIDNILEENLESRVALVHDSGHTTFANN